MHGHYLPDGLSPRWSADISTVAPSALKNFRKACVKCAKIIRLTVILSWLLPYVALNPDCLKLCLEGPSRHGQSFTTTVDR
jgi:hypothetical protein